MNDVKLPEGLDFDFIAANRDKSDRWFTKAEMLAVHEQGRLAGLEEAAKAVYETSSFHWVDGSDQFGSPCPAKIVTSREDYIRAIRALAASDGGE